MASISNLAVYKAQYDVYEQIINDKTIDPLVRIHAIVAQSELPLDGVRVRALHRIEDITGFEQKILICPMSGTYEHKR